MKNATLTKLDQPNPGAVLRSTTWAGTGISRRGERLLSEALGSACEDLAGLYEMRGTKGLAEMYRNKAEEVRTAHILPLTRPFVVTRPNESPPHRSTQARPILLDQFGSDQQG